MDDAQRHAAAMTLAAVVAELLISLEAAGQLPPGEADALIERAGFRVEHVPGGLSFAAALANMLRGFRSRPAQE